MASCGENSTNNNGVAMIEKPKPELVCKIEANKIIKKKIISSNKIAPHNQ